MTKKKSFLIHIDSLDILDDLTNEQCGELFKAIKAHHSDQKNTLSAIVNIAFSPFKNQFIRDDEKYLKTCEARAIAGSIGGKQTQANASKVKQKVANQADNKNKKDNDNDLKRLDQSVIDQSSVNLYFDIFWDSGIRKVNKKKSKSLFIKIINKKINRNETLKFTNYLVSDIQKRITSNQLGFSEMHPTTYLNGERWKDEIKSPEKKSSPAIYSASHQMYKPPELDISREELQHLGQQRIREIK